MLPVGWLVVAVFVAVLVTSWVTFTVTRLDRLHARVDAAQAALDAQLVRRAAALAHVAESADTDLPSGQRREYERLAQRALSAGRAQRAAAENDVGRAVGALADRGVQLPSAAAGELREAALRVQIARRFYNDAVRDTRLLRRRRLPRLLRLHASRPLPRFFDIEDGLDQGLSNAGHPSS